MIGFAAEVTLDEGDTMVRSLWLHDDAGDGNPEHVIAFVLRCAEAFGLTGRWGFAWGLSCSRPRLDGFGGGAHVLDLGRRETVAWVDCEHWLAERLAADGAATGTSECQAGVTRPARAETLLQEAAARESWTAATQAAVLLDFIDSLAASDPGIADRLHAYLTDISAAPEPMLRRACAEPMLVTADGIAHHAAGSLDGIDRDCDHAAIRGDEDAR